MDGAGIGVDPDAVARLSKDVYLTECMWLDVDWACRCIFQRLGRCVVVRLLY